MSGERGLDQEILAREEWRLATAYARRRRTVPAGRYAAGDPGNLFMLHERERRILALLRRHRLGALDGATVLEVGCGSGHWLRKFVEWGAQPTNLVGVDVLPDRVREARRLCPAGVTVRCESAARLTFPDASFDLVLQSTVFTSILDTRVKAQIAAEMIRVVRPSGLILWYDFHLNNPWNPDVRGVGRREIRALFRGARVTLRRVTLAPPVTRLLAPYSWMACYVLERIPLLCTHYLGVIQRSSSQ